MRIDSGVLGYIELWNKKTVKETQKRQPSREAKPVSEAK